MNADGVRSSGGEGEATPGRPDGAGGGERTVYYSLCKAAGAAREEREDGGIRPPGGAKSAAGQVGCLAQ